MLNFERFLWAAVVFTGFFGSAFLTYDLGPFTLFPHRVLMIVLWGTFLARTLYQRSIALPLRNVQIVFVFLAIWFVYAILSSAWAESKIDLVRHIVFLFMGFSLIFFAVYYTRDEHDLRTLMSLWLLALGIMLVIGFWEHLTGNHFPQSKYFGERRVDRRFVPTAVWVNPNDFATFLSISFPFALSVYRYAESKASKLVALVLSLAALYLIVASRSRANLIAVLLQLAFLMLGLTSWLEKRKLMTRAAIVLVLLLLLVPGGFMRFVSDIASDIASVATESQLGRRSVSIRGSLILNSLVFVYETAGLGVGAGNAEYWMQHNSVYDTGGIRNVHNWWFEVLLNYGILIFIGYVTMYLGIIRRLWLTWHSTLDMTVRLFTEPPLLALIGFSIGVSSPSSIAAFHPNWMLFAFALAVLNLFSSSDSKWRLV